MKMPAKGILTHPDHLFLYEHDSRELYNPDRSDFMRLMYLTRLHLVLDTVRRFAPGKRVLDVGCAQGNFSLRLAERGFQVVAMDLQHAFLQYVRMKYEHGELGCVTANVEYFPYRAHSFDVVLLGEIVEHVAYPERLLAAATGLLAPGGLLVLTTPNGGRLRTGLPTLSAIQDRQALTSKQFRPDAEGHLFLLTRAELMSVVRDAGLAVKAHKFFCSPWVTGRLGFRYVSRFLPVKIRQLLDRITVELFLFHSLLSEGQLIVCECA